MKRPYSALGGAFEYLNDDCGYEQWSQYLIKKLASLGVKTGASGVDVGCGNGYFTRALARAGYNVSGLDLSGEMLSRAVELSLAEGLRLEFLQGDIAKLKLNGKKDFITAINDCINYAPQGGLLKTFKRVNANLKRGGVFIFDISSEYKLKNVIANNLFAEDRGDCAYMWFNALSENRVDMDITLFIRESDGRYSRFDEQQTQYIHKKCDVEEALKEAGFEVDSENHPFGESGHRINFICRKL